MGKKTKYELDGGQLLLTATTKTHTQPLVREVDPQGQYSKIQTELTSGHKSHNGIDTKTY
jgi:hypothetical protein